MTIDEIPLSIHFETAKDVLRVRYATEVRRVSLIVDVDVTTTAATASTTLATRSPGAIAPCPTTAAIWGPPSLLPLLWEESAAGTET